MKKMYFICFFVVLIIISVFPKSLEQVKVIQTPDVNIFLKPYVSSSVVAKAPDGARMDVEEFGQNWLKVSMDGQDGRLIGYVQSDAVEIVKKKKAIVTTIKLPNIYKERKYGSSVLIQPQINSEFEIIKMGKSWIQIMTPKGPGWIEKKYIKIMDMESLGIWIRYGTPIVLFILIGFALTSFLIFSRQAKKKVAID
ncbi:MAG: hypothetical protein ABIA63_08050 [bacterium]